MANRKGRAKSPPSTAPADNSLKIEGRHLLQWRLHMEAKLEKLRCRMELTGNPLYLWEAIAWCGADEFPRYPLPEWCLIYLTTIASMFMTTAQMKNSLTYPVKLTTESEDEYLAKITSWKSTADVSWRTALESLPAIMKFSDGKSRNAFFEYNKDQKEITEAIIAEGEFGPSFTDPIEWIRKRNGLDTRRSATKRVRRGRALLKPERST